MGTIQNPEPGDVFVVTRDEPHGSPLKTGDVIEVAEVATFERIADLNPLAAIFAAAQGVNSDDVFAKKIGSDDTVPHGIGWALRLSTDARPATDAEIEAAK